MKLSTRVRYGTRALLDLAIHSRANSNVTLKEIAKRQEISVTYLEHLVGPLIDGGLIRSIRGSRGGVSLARPAREITLKEIVNLLEGPTGPVDCLIGSNTCPRSGACATQDIWDEMGQAIDRVLAAKTLQDLVERQNSQDNSKSMYYI
jgi:Rrf2 family transcriptional regulator, cysteine metabolism repressor